MADQKQKIWNFIGQLKENNNRVVSGVKASISGTSDTNPQFNANIDGSGSPWADFLLHRIRVLKEKAP